MILANHSILSKDILINVLPCVSIITDLLFDDMVLILFFSLLNVNLPNREPNLLLSNGWIA